MIGPLIDEAWAKVDPGAAKLAGYVGIIGYISEDNTGKNLTRAQVDAIHTQGLDVGFADEYGATEALGGFAAGRTRALRTIGFAQALGVPAGVAFYAPADWDVTDAQKPAVLSYATAHDMYLKSAGYRGGLYSGYYTCAYLMSHGYQGLLWQTYAWSGGLWLAGVAIRQTVNGIHIAGADVDRDTAEFIDWGQWPPGGRTDTMTTPPSNEDVNVYDGLYFGGPSCGPTVPPEFRIATDSNGNALFSQLAYIRAKLDALSVPASVVTADQMAAIGQLSNLLGQIAAHIK